MPVGQCGAVVFAHGRTNCPDRSNIRTICTHSIHNVTGATPYVCKPHDCRSCPQRVRLAQQ